MQQQQQQQPQRQAPQLHNTNNKGPNQNRRGNQGHNQNQNQNHNQRRPQYTRIPGPYFELFLYLMHVGVIAPKEIPPAVYPFGPHHDPNVTCAFHAGYVGHTVEDCIVFKNRVHNFIEQNILSFTEEKPNVKANPLHNHGNQTLNVIIEKDSS